MSNREEVFKVAEKVKEEVGDVTILINNAGIMPCHSFLDYTPEEVKRTFDINVLGNCWVSFLYFSISVSLSLVRER